MTKTAFIVRTEQGDRYVQPYEVRAGMNLVETDYHHDCDVVYLTFDHGDAATAAIGIPVVVEDPSR